MDIIVNISVAGLCHASVARGRVAILYRVEFITRFSMCRTQSFQEAAVCS
jgi:hypothetical protein